MSHKNKYHVVKKMCGREKEFGMHLNVVLNPDKARLIQRISNFT